MTFSAFIELSIAAAVRDRIKDEIFDASISDISLPRLPFINKLSCTQEKGCQGFYRTLLSNETRITGEVESKWQESLRLTISISGWNKIFELVRNRFVSNRLRWVQIQIIQFRLPTNYTVSRYNPSQSPACSFCPDNSHYEYLPALFWECPVVQKFWISFENILGPLFPDFKLDKKAAIFGDNSSNCDSVVNTILLWSRYFIWREKFTLKMLTENSFLGYIKDQIIQLLEIFSVQRVPKKQFKLWIPVFEYFDIAYDSIYYINDIMS